MLFIIFLYLGIVNFYTKIFDIFCAIVDHKLVFRLGLFLLYKFVRFQVLKRCIIDVLKL